MNSLLRLGALLTACVLLAPLGAAQTLSPPGEAPNKSYMTQVDSSTAPATMAEPLIERQEFRLSTVHLANIDESFGEWRSGIGFPFAYHQIGWYTASLNLGLVSDSPYFERSYIAAYAAADFWTSPNGGLSLGLAVGYSGDISDLSRIQNGQWGAGFTATVRFGT